MIRSARVGERGPPSGAEPSGCFGATTRSIGLTTDGATYYERCARILHELEDAEGALAQSRGAVRGRLRYELRATWLGGTRILDKLETANLDMFARRPTLTKADVPAVLWGAIRWRQTRASRAIGPAERRGPRSGSPARDAAGEPEGRRSSD